MELHSILTMPVILKTELYLTAATKTYAKPMGNLTPTGQPKTDTVPFHFKQEKKKV
jgi:hypothetical protein